MRFDTFSRRQLEALSWWCDDSPHRERDAVICDGAVRSGKTLCMSLSFALWSMERFSGQSFALCGKTVTSLRRNLVTPLTEALAEAGVACEHKVSQSLLILRRGLRQNRYYLFGGRDGRAAALIQGVTLAGVLLDEVALMPRSFVEQALARCSVAGSKFWFSCNPDHPGHWFHREWIKEAERKNALYLHFSLEDNPSLSPEIAGRYKALYTGVFHERYVLGHWVTAHGAVYPMFCEARHVVDAAPACARHVISCDYGTVNPSSFGLWGCAEGVWIRLREYYHDSRKEGVQRTDAEYADALEALHCSDDARQPDLDRFVEEVRVGPCARGLRRFASVYLDSLLTYGNAVGEIVPTLRGDGVYALYNARLTDVRVKRGGTPLEVVFCAAADGAAFAPVRRPELILFTALNPPAGELLGTPLLRSLPFVTGILLNILGATGRNFERMANLRYAVTYKPGPTGVDKAYAKEIATSIADQWGQAMSAAGKGVIKDFVAVGDVDIKVIDADCQMMDTQVPVRQMLEQIVAKLGVPPFMLGLHWSSTERMSTQQADILTSELMSYQQLLSGVLCRVCDTFLHLNGWGCKSSITWDEINLQDEVESANARLLSARARRLECGCGCQKPEGETEQ